MVANCFTILTTVVNYHLFLLYIVCLLTDTSSPPEGADGKDGGC